MALKAIHTAVAVLGIAALSGGAWWYQNRSTAPSSTETAVAGPGAANAPNRAASGAGGTPAVETGQVQVMKLIDDTQAVGSLRSRQSVVLRPEVSGRITQLNFRDGARVRKGQVLVQFDDQLPLAQVQQSQAEMSIAQANHKRNQELVAQNFISQRSVDESAANLQVAQAKLALSQATAQRLKIIAPFDGIAGIRSVNVGDYLKDGADVVNIEDMDAVFVDFRLPERFQSKVRRGQQASVELDALPGRKFVAFIQAVDPLIDANGRSVGVRGCIDNRAAQLRPGMFARVTTVFGQRDNALVIPEEAIVPQGGRQFVLKVVDGPDGAKVSQRVEVKVGIRRPGRVEITSGLNEGDRIITAGQQRVQKDGTAVRIIQVAQAAAGAAPGASAPAPVASAPATPGAPASAPSGSPASLPSGAAPAGVKTAAAKPAGPNPCLIGMADIDAAPGAGRRKPGAPAEPPKGVTPRPTAPMRSPA
ncbi:MAG: efflux RND transporter periplasmic adaptor subunit [Burkholderiaceae bacterium]|nr:efflux RND transporter periplasmic adaptor subunit [Burkholderiaceae bacterium]